MWVWLHEWVWGWARFQRVEVEAVAVAVLLLGAIERDWMEETQITAETYQDDGSLLWLFCR